MRSKVPTSLYSTSQASSTSRTSSSSKSASTALIARTLAVASFPDVVTLCGSVDDAIAALDLRAHVSEKRQTGTYGRRLEVRPACYAKQRSDMGISLSILLVAIGAILTWAVSAEVSGVDITAVGVILLIVGLAGLVLSLVFWSSWGGFGARDGRGGQNTTIVERDRA